MMDLETMRYLNDKRVSDYWAKHAKSLGFEV